MKYPLSDTDQYSGKITFLPIAEEYIDLTQSAAATVKDIQGLGQFTNATTSNATDIKQVRY